MWRVAVAVGLMLGLCMAAVAFEEASNPFGRVQSGMLNIEQPYVDKSLTNRYYDYGGDTMIRNDRYIRLTPDKQDKRGSFFSKVPLIPGSFQVEFEFRIHGQGSSIYGDGMAFWLLDRAPNEGPVFGVEDKFNGLGVFFDTYKNDRPGRAFPYVMAMLGDGRSSYDNEHDGAANEIAGCSARGLHNSDRNARARFTFVKDGFMALELNYKSKGVWETCFHTTDVPGLPVPSYMGFSAQTGELSENHDIISAQVYQLTQPPTSFAQYDELVNGRKPAVTADGKSSGSGGGGGFGAWLWWLVKSVFYLLLVAGVAYLAFTLYRAHKRKNRDGYIL